MKLLLIWKAYIWSQKGVTQNEDNFIVLSEIIFYYGLSCVGYGREEDSKDLILRNCSTSAIKDSSTALRKEKR